MSHILVIPAARTTDIRQVAEAIAVAATASGAAVRVAAPELVGPPLSGWDLLVLGAPLRDGRWPREAHRFLHRNRDELSRVPVAVFGLGSAHTDAGWERNHAGLDRALERHPWLVPLAVALFDAMPSGRQHPMRTGLRDWTAIGDWTRKLVALVDAEDGPC